MTRHRSAPLPTLLALLLLACQGAPPDAAARSSEDAVTSNGVDATLTLQSDWGAGYCANVVLSNGGTAAVSAWTVVIELNQATLTQLWSAGYAVSGGVVTVTGLGWNSAIAPGASVSFGLCGAATGTSYRPTLASVAVTGGSTTPTSYTLTLAAGAGGTTTPAAGSYTYAAGAAVSVTATPASGYTLTGWSGAATGTSNPVTVTLDGNKALTASFAPVTPTTYTLSLAVNGAGTTTPAAGSYTYAAGAVVSVTATPASGYTFTGWSGAASGTSNPVTVTLDGNKALTASFAPVTPTTFTLTVAVSGSGTTAPAAGSYTYAAGTAVTVTATPASGASFTGWSGAATGAADPVTVTMDANKTLTASFAAGGLDACMTSSATSPSGFGVTDSGSALTVNSGTGLVYVVSRSNGSITSIKWRGTELNDAAKGSQIASGLGSATVGYRVANGVALVTATAVNAVASSGTVIHYLATRQNENSIYMATYTTAEPDVGELRWITRLRGNLLTGVPAQSNNSGNTGAIESSDVFGHAGGTTTSKYYGNQRARELSIRGVTGSGVGVFMVYGSRETSSGGPFFKDIQNQSDTGADAELYNYMNSGHNQTDAWRLGLHGPYALRFTNGCTPSIPDLGWMSSLGLTGWVSARGAVSGSGIAGRDGRSPYLVAFSNSTAQYWADADATTGAFTSPAMIPGTYAVTVYKRELGVWTGTVAVTAGATTSLGPITITADPSSVPAVWRIGDWDGTPLEFANGANIGLMHPQDVRMSAWGPVTYAVGSSSPASFPAVQFRGANTPTTIRFNLTSGQVAAHTVKIGITSAYANGRPVLKINGWTSSTPSPSAQPSSRSITIGTYRGNNQTFTYSVPASAFVTGTNTLTIDVASGSSDLSEYLSASFSYDCVELD